MEITKESFLDRVLEGYVSNYNIDREADPEHLLYAKAEMHLTESQHFVMEQFKMWSADSDEYVYFYITDHLTEQAADEIIKYTYDQGFPKIDIEHRTMRNQHMCTRLVANIVCDTMDEAAAKKLKKCRIYKSFQFSLKGWMEFHAVGTDLGKRSVVSNRFGLETAKYLKKVLAGMDR